MGVMLGIIAVITIYWLISASFKKAREKEQARQRAMAQGKAQELAEAACRFVSQVNAQRCFPEVSAGDVSIRKGEFAIMKEPATLFEQKTHRVSSAVGTRVKIGKMPVYLGSGHSTSYETSEPIATGELVMTNSRVIFISDNRSATMTLKDVVGVNANLSQITIHSSKRKSPYIFAVTNPVLWALLAKIGASHPLESRFIPEGVTLKATPTETPGDVHFETNVGQAAAQLQ